MSLKLLHDLLSCRVALRWHADVCQETHTWTQSLSKHREMPRQQHGGTGRGGSSGNTEEKQFLSSHCLLTDIMGSCTIQRS